MVELFERVVPADGCVRLTSSALTSCSPLGASTEWYFNVFILSYVLAEWMGETDKNATFKSPIYIQELI